MGHVQGEAGPGRGGQEVEGEGVDGNAAILEKQVATGGARLFLGLGQLGVFDDPEAGRAIPRDRAEPLGGVPLGADLEGELAAASAVEADEGGVGDVDQGIVHLEVEERVDAPAFHVVQHALFVEGLQDAAVAIGAREEFAGAFEDQAAVGEQGGQHALGEEEDAFRGKAEVGVGGEEGAGGAVVGLAGHDIKGDGGAEPALEGGNFAGVDLEEGGA